MPDGTAISPGALLLSVTKSVWARLPLRISITETGASPSALKFV